MKNRPSSASPVSRRGFLGKVVAAAAAAPLLRAEPVPKAPTVFGKPVGLQLYSLRNELPKDVPGTLAKIRAMGFREIEGGSDYKLGDEGFKAEVAKAGLVLTSAHFGLEDWQKDPSALVKRSTTWGLKYAGCAWIPHKDDTFTREDCLRAGEIFNAAGKATKAAGIKFFYHLHGYEFVASPEGTLFDTLAKNTDAALVGFQADIFWVTHGGATPGALFEKYPKRFLMTHLKDMKRGTPIGLHTGHAADDSNVVLGTGMIDWPTVLKACKKAGIERHFIEDEHVNAIAQIPQSLGYLRQFA
jgi:sugar phosphate isomerase/epimerase